MQLSPMYLLLLLGSAASLGPVESKTFGQEAEKPQQKTFATAHFGLGDVGVSLELRPVLLDEEDAQAEKPQQKKFATTHFGLGDVGVSLELRPVLLDEEGAQAEKPQQKKLLGLLDSGTFDEIFKAEGFKALGAKAQVRARLANEEARQAKVGTLLELRHSQHREAQTEADLLREEEAQAAKPPQKKRVSPAAKPQRKKRLSPVDPDTFGPASVGLLDEAKARRSKSDVMANLAMAETQAEILLDIRHSRHHEEAQREELLSLVNSEARTLLELRHSREAHAQPEAAKPQQKELVSLLNSATLGLGDVGANLELRPVVLRGEDAQAQPEAENPQQKKQLSLVPVLLRKEKAQAQPEAEKPQQKKPVSLVDADTFGLEDVGANLELRPVLLRDEEAQAQAEVRLEEAKTRMLAPKPMPAPKPRVAAKPMYTLHGQLLRTNTPRHEI